MQDLERLEALGEEAAEVNWISEKSKNGLRALLCC